MTSSIDVNILINIAIQIMSLSDHLVKGKRSELFVEHFAPKAMSHGMICSRFNSLIHRCFVFIRCSILNSLLNLLLQSMTREKVNIS